MDITGLQTFSEVIEQFHNRGVVVYICEANLRIAQKLEKIGIFRWLSGGRIFDTLTIAGSLVDKVFNPLLQSGGLLASSVGAVIGIGAGRDIGLMFILAGFSVTIIAIIIGRLKLLNKLD